MVDARAEEKETKAANSRRTWIYYVKDESGRRKRNELEDYADVFDFRFERR
ncbi:hypothetical protein AtNW77_Chr3g0177371 [Arabidopsis thaliana]|uniref:Uncharacterized protein n=4 Tax=Arabidopsis TaxID=3701 RepID=A0A654FDV9_ARATH|nr:uncharacterized protein AT3G18957 [Arabidopsis thaliana]KAG7625768.1 hypothetical protein ISN45_At03g019840 [Arabidopsis thaliana x Arabidopsis arenosa]KAG7631773.1 hypothetical protein ISN44_As03g019740 [Arabidopsis suecica]AEE76173.1 hypothetical protein AT3G18957 [Arabidopsis thaliana]CAA0382923.1 unnamed protein product [Arabidopsis thaliana]VYS57862.1 unnamed protein product [Arabidopsis thaliana]|eukprot:NP_001154625.1 hypothetical protein AT3G18957 [Arabidopsis thaliana]